MTAMLALSAPDKSLWYLTRGSGAVALVLLTASMVLGVATSVGAESRPLPRFVVQAVHRNVSLLVTMFVVLHVGASVTDRYVPLGWLDAVVPWRSPYRRIWTGLGALAFDLFLAVGITSLLRARIGLRTWRVVHWTSYASWPIALVHSFGTGSDTREAWLLVLAGACAMAVAGAVGWRLAARRPADRRVLVGAIAATLLVPLLIAIWLRLGPLQDDWGVSDTAAPAGSP